MMDLGDGCFLSTPGLDDENPFNQNLNTDEELSNSQKPTQPLFEANENDDFDDSIDESQEIAKSYGDNVWGVLYPMRAKLRPIFLESNEITVGRHPSCTHPLDTDQLNNKALASLSKTQFKIVRNGDDVRIFDLSSNGTPIDGRRIPTNGMSLVHNASIGLASMRGYVFQKTSREYHPREGYPREFRRKYATSIILGSGASAEVIRAFRKEDQQAFAVKCMDKIKARTNGMLAYKRMTSELHILKKVSHPNIISFVDHVDTPEKLFLVLELAHVGELFNIILEDPFSELKAKFYFYQMANAVEYLHRQNIVHRDLKPENMLLCVTEDQELVDVKNRLYVLKITDMGLAKDLKYSEAQTFCGTPHYLSPEMLINKVRHGGYGLRTDNWSIGVILFTMIAQRQPFRESRPDGLEFLKQVLEYNWTFEPEGLWAVVSEDCKDMVRKLLVHFKRRLTSSEILEHPWLQDENVIRKAEKLVRAQYSDVTEDLQVKRSLPLPPDTQANDLIDFPQEVKGLCSKRVRYSKENGELNL